MAKPTGVERPCPGCGAPLFVKVSSGGAELLVDGRGRLHLCPKAVVQKPRPESKRPESRAPDSRRPESRRPDSRRPEARRSEHRPGPPRGQGASRPAAGQSRPTRPERPRGEPRPEHAQRPQHPPRPARPPRPQRPPRPALASHQRKPAPRPAPKVPEPIVWDVLANRHVRCGKCQEPVRVTKEQGRVVLDEIDGSAPHECGRELFAPLEQARAAARAAVTATLERLAERKEQEPRDDEAAASIAPAPVARPRRPRRVANAAAGEAREPGATSRDCPSCGRLMAGIGDTLVCLYCGS